jgi:hypothetical protein
VQSLLEPGKKHVIEEVRREKRKQEESGDPPLPEEDHPWPGA